MPAEICVGNAAVEPHVLNHGDLVGPCDPPDDNDDDDDDNDPPGPPSDHPSDVIP